MFIAWIKKERLSVSDQAWVERSQNREVMESYCNATFSSSRKSITLETYEIWRKKNPTAYPYMNPNKLAKMRRAIIKNIYLSEIEIDKIKLKAQ